MTIQVAQKLIKKRTGQIVVHNPDKLVSAIYRAQQSLGKGDEQLAKAIAKEVDEHLDEEFFSKNIIPDVEQIQDVVENFLMNRGLFEVAKAYIVYRHERTRIRNQQNVVMDVKKTIEQYLGVEEEGRRKDWRVKENANQDFDYPGLNAYISGSHLARYGLYTLYPPEIAEAHVTGHIHIHDLSNSIVGYCAGWSLQLLLQKGFGGIKGRVASKPPKHLDSAINQMITFLDSLQNEFAGAQAFSSVDTLLAPFIRHRFGKSVEKILRQTFSLKVNGNVYLLLDLLYKYNKGMNNALSIQEVLENLYPNVIFSPELLNTFLRSFNEEYEENISFIRQNIQNLIYAVNQTSRWGGQSPFVNLSFDWTVPSDLADQNVILAGNFSTNILYKDCQTEADILNRVFIEEMSRGDRHNRVFTFPIPTYSITKDFDWNHPNVELLMQLTAKYGIPYFQNYNGSGLEPSSIRAMCCRLNLNILELQNRPGGMWSIGDSTGSIGVVTINLSRLGYQAVNEEDFFSRLRKYMELSKISLEIKRKEVSRNLKNGMMAYAREYLPHGFKTYFSTIGLCGMNECCLNFLGEGIETETGKLFTLKVLNFMKGVCDEFKIETGNLYNLEATPAESTSYRFARLDRKYYSRIICSGTEKTPFLTNSTNLPVNATADLIEAIEHQNDLQPLYTGGTMFHTYLGEEIDSKACKNLVKQISEKTALPYFSITPTFSICIDHNYIKGKHFECPFCGKETEVYSRIVGYFRPVSKWNDGKTQEFQERTVFRVPNTPLQDIGGIEKISQGILEMNGSSDRIKNRVVDKAYNKILVFTSPNCPKCAPFKSLIHETLESNSIQEINTTTSEGIALAEKFNVHSVPLAIAIFNENEICRFSNSMRLNEILPTLYQKSEQNAS